MSGGDHGVIDAYMGHEGNLEDLEKLASSGDVEAAQHVRAVTSHTQRVEEAPKGDPYRCIRCGSGLPGKYSFVMFYTLTQSEPTQACCKCAYDDLDDAVERATEFFEMANPGKLIDWQEVPRPALPSFPTNEPIPPPEFAFPSLRKEAFKREAAGFINLFLYHGRAFLDIAMAAEAGDEEAQFLAWLFVAVDRQIRAALPHYPPNCACCSRDFIPSSLVLAAAIPATRGPKEVWPILLCDSCGDEGVEDVQARVAKRVRRDFPEAHLAWPSLPGAGCLT